jgi:hypothetical protein
VGGIFKGLAGFFDELAALAMGTGGGIAVLEFLLIILAFLNVFKGPLVLLALILWRVKWGTLSDTVGRAGAFVAGFITLYDWTEWSLDPTTHCGSRDRIRLDASLCLPGSSAAQSVQRGGR